ncbi:MAG: restriction endonuclease subunit S [Prevotellaceae bacterium]|nr:restriction endonuclease subunit S [Prevotellaceae bacterium]MDY2750514.1 restriction endonuclease subunit S [Prevotella sp.]
MKEPKIRFIGFKGEWETSIIGDIATFSKGRGYSKSDLRSEGNPIVLYGRLYTNYSSVIESVDTFASLQNGSVLTKGNEVIIPGSGETPEDIAVASAVEQKGVILGGDLNVLTFDQEKISPAFAAMSITYSNTHNELSGYAQGKTVVHLHNSSISKGHISYPYIDEQQSISSYFQRLDSLIQSTTKKIESLKQVKAASLQSMFPQEGATTPRVRFKGFEGEWSICPLKYFAKKSTEKNISMDYTITLTNSAEYGVINQRDFFDHDISNDDHINGYYVIHHDDFVYNPRVSTAAPVGPISRNRLGYSGVMSPLYLIFRVNGINKDFLSYYFKTTLWHNYMKLEGNTGARFDRLAISDEQFFNMPIYYPKDEEEQTAIASYFTNLDRQITLHTQRLEKLKQIKSACLDNMFV